MLRRPQRKMTISELKRALDRRFDRLERSKVDKAEFRRFQRALNRRLLRMERTKVDKAEFRTALARLRAQTRQDMDAVGARLRDELASADQTLAHVKANLQPLVNSMRGEINRLRVEIAASAEETRRHFDLMAEDVRGHIRVFADPLSAHTERLEDHEARIATLEQRSR
jgi:hypothetical protein